MWWDYTDDIKLQTGDILEVTAAGIIFPNFIKHYAIVFQKNKKLYVSHSMMGYGPKIQPFEDFMLGGERPRTITKFFRDDTTRKLTSEYIEEKSKDLIEKSKKHYQYRWSFWDWNCEDYVKEISPESKLGFDHRSTMIIIGLIIIIILLLIFYRRKT